MYDLHVRVWDREAKRMGVPHAVILQDGQPIAIYVSWHKTCCPIYNRDLEPQFIIMYSTGKNDQNGQRIYGGDILKEYGPDDYTLNEVKFGANDSDYGWYADYIQSFTFDDEPTEGRFSRYLSLHDIAEHSIVIGNVYEHAYLLTSD